MPTQRQTTGLEAEAWARRTARGLRRTHASFAAAGVGDREGFLEDQIKESLAEAGATGAESRAMLLEKLGQCFSRETEGFAPAPAESVSTESHRDAVGQVGVIWREASESTRRAILRELHRASPELAQKGLGGRGDAAGVDPELTERVRLPSSAPEMDAFKNGLEKLWKVLGHETQPAPAVFYRLWKLLGILAEAYCDLHNVTWTFWRKEAPEELQLNLARLPCYPEAFLQVNLPELISKYLTDPEGTGTDEFFKEVDATKRLSLGAIEAMRFGGREFFGSLRQISPESIENAIRFTAGGGALRGDAVSAAAWKKYRELTEHEFNEVEVRDQFKKCAINTLYAWVDAHSRR
jgi:hypothetical protein